jgi:hypothetical protein
MCLKFQLIKKSALFIVAKAICMQYAKLVYPTTFSAMYSFAKSIASLSQLKTVWHQFLFIQLILLLSVSHFLAHLA